MKPVARVPAIAVSVLTVGIPVVAVLVVAGAARADECGFFARTGAKVTMVSATCDLGEDDQKKTGKERCLHEGKPVASFVWRGGKRDGDGWYTDYNDQKIEAHWRAGAIDGPVKVYAKSGALMCELTVAAGKTEGVVRELHPGGKLRRAELFKSGERAGPRIELTPDGKVVELVCGEKSFVKEDQGPCGHDGKVATVSFFDPDGKPRRFTVKHERGRRVEQETVDARGRQMVVRYLPDGHEEGTIRHPNGKTAQAFVSLSNGRYDGPYKEWNEAGQLLEEDRYAKGKLVAQKLHFQNGAVKLDAVLDEKTGVVAAKQFRDTGKLSQEGTYKPGSCWGDRCDFQHLEGHGVVKSYDERGQLSEEAQWSEGKRDGYDRVYHRNGKIATDETYKRGTRTHLRCLDPGGATELEEEYFEDGSRKAAGRAVPQEERAQKQYCQAR